MELHVCYNGGHEDKTKVEIKGFPEVSNENIEEVLLDTSGMLMIIVDEFIRRISGDVSPEKKKVIAEVILDHSKDTIGMYYDDMQKIYDERTDVYNTMVEYYEHILIDNNIDEEELIKLAKENEASFDTQKADNKYVFNLVLGDKSYLVGEVLSQENEHEINIEAFKASMFVTVLFDKAFPDDESRNPMRQDGMINPFADLIHEEDNK